MQEKERKINSLKKKRKRKAVEKEKGKKIKECVNAKTWNGRKNKEGNQQGKKKRSVGKRETVR